MEEYKLKLIEKRDEAQGTKSFIFEKPEGFTYIAGEFMYFTLPQLKYPDPRGTTRHFTLSSSPTEDYLSLTTRLREQSGYKKTLNEFSLGSVVDARGPTGVLIMPDDVQNPQVMLAGGIGITPFRSRIKYVTDKNLPIQIHLIYANSHTEEITFKKELDEISQAHKNIKVTYFVSEPTSNWKGEKGRINSNFLSQLTTHYSQSTYWVCGPPPMVTAMEEILEQMKIPTEQIKTEKFTGY